MEYRRREVLFREVVIHFMIGETKEEKEKRQTDEFCRACRAAKKDKDCDFCSRSIEVRDPEKEEG